jgi:hypothetical protein
MNEIEKLKKEKDNAYWERNQLVAALSKLFPAHLAKHDPNDKEWDADRRTIVYIYLPADENDMVSVKHWIDGKAYYQTSWHIQDREIPMFDHLDYGFNENGFYKDWDNHDTEEKYRRLRKLAPKKPKEIQ